MTDHALPERQLTTAGIMLAVLLALLPAVAVHIWFAGTAWTLGLLAGCTLALALEALALRLRGRDAALRRQDGSVLITAMLLLLMLPTTLPWWQPAVAIIIAVILGKQLFGGLGQNLFNPVAVGYLGLMTLFPASPTMQSSFLPSEGQTWITATMVLAVLAGGLFLLHRRIIGWHIPVSMLLTTVILFYGLSLPLNYSVMTLAALFIATDPTTSPGTRTGKLIYGCMVALVSAAMANWLSYPEAVACAILCGNAITPTLDQTIRHNRNVWQSREKR